MREYMVELFNVSSLFLEVRVFLFNYFFEFQVLTYLLEKKRETNTFRRFYF